MNARVLITRELSPASIALLQHAAIDYTAAAFIQTQTNISTATADAIRQRLPLMQHIVFTSKAAIQAVEQWLTQASLEWPASVQVHCLNGGSLQAFRNSRLRGTVSCTANSARALAQQLIARKIDVVDFFAGESRREELPSLLKEAGVALREHIVYQTIALNPPLPDNWGYILFFSPSAVDSFFKNNAFPGKATAIAIGSTTAESLRRQGVSKIVISEAPSEQEMIHTLLDLLQAPQTYKY